MATLKPWRDYLHIDNPAEAAAVCQMACGKNFKAEHNRLCQLQKKLKPEAVAVLGAGCLNDIPIREFLEEGTHVALVDWVPGLTQAGLARKMVYRTEEGLVCICCRSPDRFAPKICTNFFPPKKARNLCRQFQPSGSPDCQCGNFSPGPEPSILEGDVSGGLGHRFAESVFSCVSRSPNPGTALRQMKKVLGAAAGEKLRMPLPAASFDLVVSAMVVSQFNFEPHGYLSSSLLARYTDTSAPSLERRVRELQRQLFQKMLAGHLGEIRRLLKPQGRAYLSFEVLHRKRDRRRWFLPSHVAPVLEEISKRFECSDDAFPLTDSLRRIEVREGESLVQSFLLTAA